MKPFVVFCILTIASFFPLMAVAQNQEEVFSIATLNVDGLPDKLLIFSINPEGPGGAYTPVISEYLAGKGYDFIAVQENFNFNAELCSKLDANYQHDLWPGDMKVESFDFDMMSFPYDGLNSFWRSGLTVERTDSVKWAVGCGLVDHCNDLLATKGFRRYDVTLKGGSQIVVYNMHMDATDEKDELTGADREDREARMVQWRQLRDTLLNCLDSRPVVVCGDMNSFYARDSIKSVFIDSIQSTGLATADDAWIALKCNGEYPVIKMTDELYKNEEGYYVWSNNGEALDKILYINPTGGSQLVPLGIELDSINYVRSDGTPLGDHWPLAATFRILPPAITQVTSHQLSPQQAADSGYYTLDGRRFDGRPTKKGVYIYKGKKVLLHHF